jgi:hypothetical protein
MQIKIIKRSDREQIKGTIPAAESYQSKQSNARRVISATVNFWIKDLRQKREQERILVKKLFNEEFCA